MKPTKKKQNRLEKLLRSRKNWTTATRCCQLLGLPTTEYGKRLVRSMAEHSEGKVLGGQEGYKHIDRSSYTEATHTCSILRSQANKMNKRVKDINIQFGKRFNK